MPFVKTLVSLCGLLWLFSNMAGCTQTYSTEVNTSQKISENSGNLAISFNSGDQFGSAVANLGDLEVDGVIDLAVGVPYDDENGTDRGALWILFMDDNGQVDITRKIAAETGGFTDGLDDGDRFGSAVAALGDLNGDGFRDVVVGVPGDDDGGTDRGGLWVLFLNGDGTVRLRQKISDITGGLVAGLNDGDQFGSAVADIGDLNGDGITDLAVGVPFSDDSGSNQGAVWILFLNADGTVNAQQKISAVEGDFPGVLHAADQFGSAVSGLGDIDGDGIRDLAVGAIGDDDGGTERGAVWILFLNRNGTVKAAQKISQVEGKFDAFLSDGDHFGGALANLGDLNNDGVTELGVGASHSNDGGAERGAFYVLFLYRSAEVISSSRISQTAGNFSDTLSDNGHFGSALASLGDLNRDGVPDIVTSANLDDDGGADKGALWALFMAPVKTGYRVDPDADLPTLLRGTR